MPPTSSKSAERCCVLLQAPFPLSLIVRIRVTARGLLAEAQPPPNGSSQVGGHAETALTQASAVQLCRKLNQERPGGLLVAVPGTAAGECQVLCLKAVLGRVFKALHARQAALGMRLGDVKSSVILTPITPTQLGAHLTQAVTSCLTSAGWFPWPGSLMTQPGELGTGKADDSGVERELMGCNFVACPAGNVAECARLRDIEVVTEIPDRLYLILDPGVVRFRPLQIPNFSPDESEEVRAAKMKGWSAAHRGDACCVLPDLRTAWVVEMCAPDPATVSRIPQLLVEICNAHLEPSWPANTPVIHLALCQEDDSASFPCPACCVWSSGGLNSLVDKPGSLTAILDRVAGDLEASSSAIWGGKPLKAVRKGVCSWQQPVAQPATAGWTLANSLPTAPASAQDTSTKESGQRGFAPPTPALPPSQGLLAELQRLSLETEGKQKPATKGMATGSSAPTSVVGGNGGTPGPIGKPPDEAQPNIAAAPKKPVAPVLMARKKAFNPSQAAPAAAKKPPTAPRKAATAANPKATAQPPANGGGIPRAPKAAPGGGVPKAPKAGATVKRPAKAAAGPATVPAVEGMEALGGVLVAAGTPAAARAAVLGTPANTGVAAGSAVAEAPQKRKAGATALEKDANAEGAAKPARKRVKADELDTAVVEAKVTQKQAEGKLADLTVPEMKCFLKARKKPVGGKKADLVTRLEGCFPPS